MRDFWEVMFHDFTEHLDPKLLNDPEKLCNATGLLVVPAPSCPGEQVPTDRHFIRPVNVKKKFCEYAFIESPQNHLIQAICNMNFSKLKCFHLVQFLFLILICTLSRFMEMNLDSQFFLMCPKKLCVVFVLLKDSFNIIAMIQ